VLLFQLAGPMIFGVAKAISREHNAIGACQAVVFDLSEVSHLGVTAAIALENAVKEAIEVGRQVFLVGASGSTENRLQKLKLTERLPTQNITTDRITALRLAVAAIQLMSDQIQLIAPDDWHVHLRDGEMLTQVVAYTARMFRRAIVMPNLRPPVVTGGGGQGLSRSNIGSL
jgi:anti-anti-sigma regulatory factor